MAGNGTTDSWRLPLRDSECAEPFVMVLHLRSLLPGLIDGMAEAFVQDQRHRHPSVLQRLVKLEGIGRRNPLVLVAMLDQGGCAGTIYVGDGRSDSIYFRIL